MFLLQREALFRRFFELAKFPFVSHIGYTLGFSRRFHVFAAPKQDAEHTYESLVLAFRYFGGCVKTVLKNNNGKVV